LVASLSPLYWSILLFGPLFGSCSLLIRWFTSFDCRLLLLVMIIVGIFYVQG
jgi:hypothetical protein